MLFKLPIIAALAALAIAAPVEDSAAVEERDIEKRYTGEATYYYQRGNPGSCGKVHADSDIICALPTAKNPRSHCGDKVKISHGGRTITATAADTCPGCGSNSLDLSTGAFKKLTGGSLSAGRIDITWSFV